MPIDPPAVPLDDTSKGPASHDRAVDLLMQDREMISRMLREHQMLHEAFQHSPMAAAIHGTDGRPILWNKLYDRLHAEEIEFEMRSVLRPDDPPHECDYGDDGVYRAHDYVLPSGSIARVSAPISTEKICKDQLQAATLAQADFLASISHEIRTPLNGLLGMANLLAESGLTKGQQMYADVVLRSSKALLAITNNILDLTKIEAGRLELTCKSFDIADSIEETATLFAASADDKGIDLIVRVDPALPLRLIGDESRLRQIVANLLGNAIRFTETGHILLDLDAKMGTREDGRRVARLTCRVQDTGIGIAPDLCDKVFDRFALAGSDPDESHSGLGLAVVAALVDKMGGTVGVDSVEGEGATFHFTIELPVDASETMRVAGKAVRSKRILLVDSETVRRTIVSESVEAWGFDIVSCESSQEALALMDQMEARGERVDLILLGEKIAEGKASLLTGALRERSGSLPPVILMARLAALSLCDDDEAEGVVLAATLPRPVQSRCLLESINRALRAGPTIRPIMQEEPAVEEPRETVAVPLVDTQTDSAPVGYEENAPTPPTATEQTASAFDILVAEDNEINQLLIEEILRQTDYTYRIVGDGSAALEAWRNDRPRLILMDVSMPVMSGDEATKHIRAEEEGKIRTPIVAVTAHALRGDRERCLRAGMDDHLTKPVTIDSIRKVVDFHLQPQSTAAIA